MLTTILSLMRYTNNYFPAGSRRGLWTCHDGFLTHEADSAPQVLLPNCYILFQGEGYNALLCTDEMGALPDFPEGCRRGTLTVLLPPPDFLRIAKEIHQWQQENPASPILSAASGDTRVQYDSCCAQWPAAFSMRLLPYRRMVSEVSL